MNIAQKIKDALAVWTNWMRYPDNSLGYPRSSVGFMTGGLHSFDDLEKTGDLYTAKSVNAIIKGLPPLQKEAVDHFHLGAKVTHPSLENDYAHALIGLEIGLRKKGII